MFNELVDVKEDNILQFNYELFSILLKDQSTKKNIIWATDNYVEYGHGFLQTDYITVEKITGIHGDVIKPRSKKTKEEKLNRIRNKAEVFTPSWICNSQNNMIDDAWFGRKNVFNKQTHEFWETNNELIKFENGKIWIDYIKALRMEISCGEAPYLVSRYDTVTGKSIDIKDRIGMLDRKFRVLNENQLKGNEWLEYSKEIIKSIYGYDWQGDNVLLARENILYTYIDNYRYIYKEKPSCELIKEIAEIISWNIWQMDGVNYIVPYSCVNSKIIEYTLFGEEEKIVECLGCKKNNIHIHNGIYSKVMNWETNRSNKFINLISRSKKYGNK